MLAECDHPRVTGLAPQTQALLLTLTRLVDVTLQQEHVAEIHEGDGDGALVARLDAVGETLLVQGPRAS